VTSKNLYFCHKKKGNMKDYPSYYAPDRADWRQWLADNHETTTGVWLVYYKKGSGKTRVEYDEAVEEAICFGWIDSVVNSVDEFCYKQLFTPRKPKSKWSKLNKTRVEQLEKAGLIMPAGQRLIDLAKATGTWNALDEVELLVVPPDLEAALEAMPPALTNWEAFSRSTRRGILEWLGNAKRPETRQARLQQIAEMAAINLRAQFDKRPD
jgi:uncharacterized protein YdeI (YjbR/CyaY-like superfamily)